MKFQLAVAVLVVLAGLFIAWRIADGSTLGIVIGVSMITVGMMQAVIALNSILRKS